MSEYHLDLPKEDIDAVLRTKRKAREPKACYPCHSRKVKCDRKLPCDSCIKRDHADLCTYERPLKRRQLALNGSHPATDDGSRPGSPTFGVQNESSEYGVTHIANRVSMPKETWDLMCEKLRSAQETISNLRAAVDESEPMQTQSERVEPPPEEPEAGVHVATSRMGTIHLGSRSVVAYMADLGRSRTSQDTTRTLLQENVLPRLGLDNESVTYPFVDLWSTEVTANDVTGLCSALPDDSVCREFFTSYRDIACSVYPVVYDIGHFESQMEIMLQNRLHAGGVYVPNASGSERPYGVSISWLGLLFAVLASGSQSSKLPAKERELTSQVYVCCAYQALRMTNFLSYPTLEAVQTLLVICNVLAYNMNPGNAYIVLGMAQRISTSLGLQIDSTQFSPQELYARRRVWWALAWQDSHYSISYDRPTETALSQPEIPYRRTSAPGFRSYGESMFQIISLTLSIIRSRLCVARFSMPIATVLDYKDRIRKIRADAGPHLRDRSKCVTDTQHLERLALKLHASYITSELCRSVLKSPTNGNVKLESSPGGSPDADLIASLRRDFIYSLSRTVTAYLELRSIVSIGARSWIGIQRAVSAAFLLAMQEEAREDVKVLGLLRSLEEVISERMHSESDLWAVSADGKSPYQGSASSGAKSQGENFAPTSATDTPQWARSMTQSLNALSKLNNVLADNQSHHTQNTQNLQPASGGAYGTLADPNGQPMTLASQTAGTMLMDVHNPGVLTPVTPDSTSSSDWTAANLVERANQFVAAPWW